MTVVAQSSYEYVRRKYTGSYPATPDVGLPLIAANDYDMGGGDRIAIYSYIASGARQAVTGPAPLSTDEYYRVIQQRHDGAADPAPLNGFLHLRSQTIVVTAAPDVKRTYHFYDPLQSGAAALGLTMDNDNFSMDDTMITMDQTEI